MFVRLHLLDRESSPADLSWLDILITSTLRAGATADCQALHVLMGDISATLSLTIIGFEGSKVRVFTGSSCCLFLSVRQQVSDKILGGGKRSQVLISRWC